MCVPYSILLKLCVFEWDHSVCVDELMHRDVCCLCVVSVLVSLCRCVFPSTALHTHKHTCGHLSVCVLISQPRWVIKYVYGKPRHARYLGLSLTRSAAPIEKINKSICPFLRFPWLVGVDFLLPTKNTNTSLHKTI